MHTNGKGRPGAGGDPRMVPDANRETGNTFPNSAARASLQARRLTEARRLRRQRYAARIWPLGDRVLFELVDHIAGRFGIEDEVDRLLDRFAGLDPTVLRALGGDRLPPNPTRVIGGAR